MDRISMSVGPSTRFIISTSGRISSIHRYTIFLQHLLDLDVAYMPISSHLSSKIDPESFSFTLKGMNCIGGAISKDIKHTIIPFLDEVDQFAAEIGSVNTVVVKTEMVDNVRSVKLIGYNTDAIGFKIAISQALETLDSSSNSGVSISSAVCYGYGGVTSVVVKVLKSMGIRTFISGRREEEAARRALELGCEVWSPDVEAQLFVNAAPVSDQPLEQARHFLDSLAGCVVAFDHEMPGRYLEEYCSTHGVLHVAGVTMYYPQMLAQWKLFLDGIVPDSVDLKSLLVQADETCRHN